jgi:condensin complex subunit 2
MPFDDGVDDSYDDGPGFDLANNEDESNVYTEDYIVKDLDDVRRVDKIKVNHATVAKKVDVKRLKTDLWNELDAKTAPVCLNEEVDSGEEQEHTEKEKLCSEPISFNNVVKEIEGHNTQEDVSLAFYFICVLHLANEKCLKLENGEKYGLNDFVISRDSE